MRPEFCGSRSSGVYYTVNCRGFVSGFRSSLKFTWTISLFACLLLNSGCAMFFNKPARNEITSAPIPGSAEFKRTAGALLDPPFLPGNNIKTLINGEQIFPAMLGAIKSAQHTINFESYVFGKATSRVNSSQRSLSVHGPG